MSFPSLKRGFNDNKGAKEAYTTSLKYKYDTEVNFKRGIILFNDTAYADALKDFENIQPYSEYYEAAQLNMANCRIKLKEYEQAHAILDKLIKRNTKIAHAYALKGLCFKEQDNLKEANKYFKRAKELGYTDPDQLSNE